MWLAITLPGIKSVYVLRAQNTLHFYIGPCSELAGSVQSAVSIMQSRKILKVKISSANNSEVIQSSPCILPWSPTKSSRLSFFCYNLQIQIGQKGWAIHHMKEHKIIFVVIIHFQNLLQQLVGKTALPILTITINKHWNSLLLLWNWQGIFVFNWKKLTDCINWNQWSHDNEQNRLIF